MFDDESGVIRTFMTFAFLLFVCVFITNCVIQTNDSDNKAIMKLVEDGHSLSAARCAIRPDRADFACIIIAFDRDNSK
jgi:hypothetical protein